MLHGRDALDHCGRRNRLGRRSWHGSEQYRRQADRPRLVRTWRFVVDLAIPIGARILGREQYYRIAKPEVRQSYSSDQGLIYLCEPSRPVG